MKSKGNTKSAANIAIVKGINDRFEGRHHVRNKVFHRREGVAEFFKTIEDTQDVLDHDVINFIASGDKVVSIGFFRARVKQTGKEVA